MPDQSRPSRFYPFANWALRMIFPFFLRVRVTGLEHVPPDDSLIVAFNHTIFLDPPLLGAYVPRRMVPIAKIEALSIPVLGWLIRWYGVIPIHRGAVDRRALQTALAVLRAGDGLILAPEGTRSPTNTLLRPRGGLAFIATRSDSPILPVGIVGAGRFWRNLTRLRRTEVELRIGPPFRFISDQRRPDRETMDRMVEEAMYRLAALLPAAQRGPYSDLGQATEQFIEVLAGGSE